MKHFFATIVIAIQFLACSKNYSPKETHFSGKQTPAQTTINPLSAETPNIYEFLSGPEGDLSIHIYSEDDIWIVEKNKIADDGLPTPQGRWTFTTREKSYAFATSHLGVHENNRNNSALDREPSRELIIDEKLASKDVLWPAINTWSWEWEIAFAKWMRTHLKPSFFQDLGIENDCADAYYQARMIFAYENSLPVSFRLAGGGAYFTQKTVRPEWKKLKSDSDWKKNKRFLKALDYIADTTYTHTLGRDTYPIAITAESLIEGTAYLSLNKTSGHTLLVNEINLGDAEASKTRLPMYTLSSTVPKTVRPLYESMFYESSQPSKSEYGHTGFVRFRWPKSSGASELIEAKNMPHYSLEQYSEDFMNTDDDVNGYVSFSFVVFKRLNPNFNPALRITEGLREISEMMESRKQVVNEGYAICKNGCTDGSSDYENWSTPSRDKRIKSLFTDLESYQNALYGFSEVQLAWQKSLSEPIIELDGTSYIFSHVKWTFDNNFFSSNPNVAPDARWGLAADVFAAASYADIQEQLQVRKNKIKTQDNKCASSPTCFLFSDEYLSTGTFVEDAEMLNLVEIRNQYCSFATKAQCEAFKSELAKFPTIAPGHSHFLQTWENISSFNSSPDVSESQKWGGLPSNLKTLTVEGRYTILGHFAQIYLLYKDIYPKSELAVLDVETQQLTVLHKSDSDVVISMEPTSGKVAVVDKKTRELFIYDLQTAKSQLLSLTGFDAAETFYPAIFWISSNRFLVSYSSTVAAFEAEANNFALVAVKPNYAAIKSSPYVVSITNLETNSLLDSKYKISIVNIFDAAQTEISFWVNEYIGNLKPNHITTAEIQTPHFLVFKCIKYDTNYNATTATIEVNLKTGVVQKNSSLPENLIHLNKNVYFTVDSGTQDNKSTTHFYFITDDLKVDSHIAVPGDCGNCYYSRADNLQIGASVYNVDFNKKTVLKTLTVKNNTAGITDNDVLSSSAIYGKYAILSFYSDVESYSVGYDLEKNIPIISGEALYLSGEPSVYPLLNLNSSFEKTDSSENKIYYTFNALLDLENLSAGPLATPHTAFSSGDNDEGEHERLSFNPNRKIDISNPAISKWSLTIHDPTAFKAKKDPISIINYEELKTVFIFR